MSKARGKGPNKPPNKNGSEMIANEDIRAKDVRVVFSDEQKSYNGGMAGSKIMNREDALDIASELGLDLVIVAFPQPDPNNTNPHAPKPVPTCKIMDLGKHLFDQSKREKAKVRARKAKQVHVKEMQFRPRTDEHDMQTKIKKICGFLDDGNKVKVMVKYHGREIQNPDLSIMERIIDRLKESGYNIAYDSEPNLNGRNLLAIIRHEPDNKDGNRGNADEKTETVIYDSPDDIPDSHKSSESNKTETEVNRETETGENERKLTNETDEQQAPAENVGQ